MIKHGLAALIANEKVTLKIAIKKDDKEQIERSNSYIDEVNAVIKNLTEDECHLTTYMVPAYKQYIDDDRERDAKLLISFSIYEDEATISFHWNVPKD